MILLECVADDDDQLSASQASFTTDEGYSSDEKQPRVTMKEADDRPTSPDREIPILKSTRTIRITYTPTTYTLVFSIVVLSLHLVFWQHPPAFSRLFTFIHLVFHLSHLSGHWFQHLTLERICVVYGTWLFWTGWLLGVLVFRQPLPPLPTLLFWLLMLERRNAWGILVWEYVGRLDQNLPSSNGLKWHQIGSIRLLAFRVWCLLGTGSFWGLLYLIASQSSSLTSLIQLGHLCKLGLVSVAGGLMMIIFWSFWTFQYRGILWHHELRKGVVVWYSEGMAFAGDIE